MRCGTISKSCYYVDGHLYTVKVCQIPQKERTLVKIHKNDQETRCGLEEVYTVQINSKL